MEQSWNPAGINGQASGPLSDVFIMFVWRIDKNGRTTFPFNWGMGDHLPWQDGYISWRYSGNNRTQTDVGGNGEPLLIMLEYSVSKGIQKAYKNGESYLFHKHHRRIGTLEGHSSSQVTVTGEVILFPAFHSW